MLLYQINIQIPRSRICLYSNGRLLFQLEIKLDDLFMVIKGGAGAMGVMAEEGGR